MAKRDRRLTLHVRRDGCVVAVVTCPALDMAISRHVFTQGWKYLLGRGQLVDRANRDWADLTSEIFVTFETE